MVFRRTAVLAVSCAWLGGCATLGHGKRWSPPDQRYSIELPRTWSVKDQSSLPVPGVVLTKPSSLGPVNATIKLGYFPLGNPYLKNWVEAMQQSAPGAKVENATLTGRPAHVAVKRFTQPYPQGAPNAEITDFRTMYVFIEDAGGFWEFEYTAVEERYSSYLSTFDRIVKSLRTGG